LEYDGAAFMAILKREPSGRVTSADELLAIAHAMELEAGRRYREFSDHMRQQGEEQLACIFDFLARIEDRHAHEIDARARAVIGKTVDSTKVRWELPENFDEEEARSHLLTPYSALAIAVRNEERAFAFFSYLAANADDDRLRRLAEESARDELEHAALLRRERRKAWRDENRARASASPETETIQSITELLVQTATIERAAAAEHRALAASLAASGDLKNARLFETAAADEQSAGDDAAARLDRAPEVPHSLRPARTTRDGLRILEDVFERYAHVSERAADELVLAEAQKLAERALRRLTYTKGSIDNALIESATTN
jgi:rubrerythrin